MQNYAIIQVTLQYQRELQQKMGVPAAVAMPPVPVQPPAPLPPPTTQPSPPPPPPDPEPNIRSNIAFDNRPWNRQTGNIAIGPQITQDVMSRQQGYQNVAGNAVLNHESRQQNYQNIAVAGNTTVKQDMAFRQQGYQNVGVAGNPSLNQDMKGRQDMASRQQGYHNVTVAGNTAISEDLVSRQQGYQNLAGTTAINAQTNTQKVNNVSYDAVSSQSKITDVESEKSAEELAFDEQFRNWENEFTKWKQQNLNHPDRTAYVEYEEKMEQCRTKLLERREQMRRRKIDKNLISDVKTIAPLLQEHLQKHNSISAPILPDQSSERNYGIGSQQGNTDNQGDATDYDARYQDHDDTKETDTGENFMNNFPISGKITGGIPGLDLIEEKKPPVKPNKKDRRQKKISSEVYDLEDRSDSNRSNFDEISKGINNILGDPNLVSLLSNINNPPSSSNDRNRNNDNSQPDIQNDEFNDTQNIRHTNINEDIQQETFNNQNNTNRFNNIPVNKSDLFNSRGDNFINQQNQDGFNSLQNISTNRFNNPQNNQDNMFKNHNQGDQLNNLGDRFNMQQGIPLNRSNNLQNLQGDLQNNLGEFNNEQGTPLNRSNNLPNHQDDQQNSPTNRFNKQFNQGEFNIQQNNQDNMFNNHNQGDLFNNQGDRFNIQQGTHLNRSNNLQNFQGDQQNNQANRFNNQINRFNQQNSPFDRFNNQTIAQGDRFSNTQNNNNQNNRFNNPRPFGNDSNNFNNLQNMENVNFRNQPDNFQNQQPNFRNDDFRNRPDRTNSFPSQHNSPFNPQFDAENPIPAGNFDNAPFSVQSDRLSHFDDGETSNCSNNFERVNMSPTTGANRFDDFKTNFRRGSVEKNLDNRMLLKAKPGNAKNPFLRKLPSGSVHSGDRSQDGFGGNDFDDRSFDFNRDFGQFGNLQGRDCNILPTKIIDYEASRSRDIDEQFFKPTQIIDYEHPASSSLSTSNSKVVDYGHKPVIGGGASIPKLHGNISKVRIIDYGHQSSMENLTFKRRNKIERPLTSRKKMKQQFKKERKPITDVSNLYGKCCHSL